MNDKTELWLKFVMLFSGLALFVALVYSGAETEKEPETPSPSPTQTPSQELTPKE